MAATDVGVRVRGGVATVHVKQAVVLVLVVVTTTVQHNPGRIVVAIIQKRNPTEGRKHRTTGTIAPKLVFIDYCAKGGEVPLGEPPLREF